jgi:predicted transposase/invertase (TIGR01784 family)
VIDINNIPEILPFKDDYIFKAMLTRYDTGLIRNSMISAFTGLKIVSSEVKENEPPMLVFSGDKPIRFDVSCVTDDGTRVEIEMQAHTMHGDNSSNKHKSLRVRSLYYISRLFAGQGGENYPDLKKAIQIMLCDYTVFSDDKFIHKFYFRDDDTVLSDYCSIIYVELPKIRKSLSKPVDEMTDDERWAVFVEYVGDSKFLGKADEFEARKEFKEAMETLSKISQSENERAYYTSRLKYEMDTATEKYYLREEGKAEGIAETLINTARSLILYGMPSAEIAKVLNLPISKIEALRS